MNLLRPNKRKRRQKYTLKDLKQHDINLLASAAAVPEKTWFSFGMAYYKLRDLNLVDDETRVTYHGRKLLAALQNGEDIYASQT